MVPSSTQALTEQLSKVAILKYVCLHLNPPPTTHAHSSVLFPHQCSPCNSAAAYQGGAPHNLNTSTAAVRSLHIHWAWPPGQRHSLSVQLTPAALTPPPRGQCTCWFRRQCWMDSSVPTQWVPLSSTSLAPGSPGQYQVSCGQQRSRANQPQMPVYFGRDHGTLIFSLFSILRVERLGVSKDPSPALINTL